MPLLSRVGRRSFRMRLIVICIYVILSLGAVTMLYPFLITLNGAISNDWEYSRRSVIPRFLFSPRERYMKFLAEKYVSRNFTHFLAAYRPPAAWASFQIIRSDPNRYARLPLADAAAARRDRLRTIAQDYSDWMDTYDMRNVMPMFERYTVIKWQAFLRRRYEKKYLQQHPHAGRSERRAGALALMNSAWGEGRYTGFHYVDHETQRHYPYELPKWTPPLEEKRYQDYLDFMKSLPAAWKTPITAQYLWTNYLERHVGDFREFCERAGLSVDSFAQIPFPVETPENQYLRKLYEDFLEKRWPVRLSRLPETLAGRYRDYLRRRFDNKLSLANAMLKSDYASWEDIPFHSDLPTRAIERTLWRDFSLNEVTVDERILLIPENSYRDFLKRRYVSLAALNQAYGWNVKSWSDIFIPLAEVDAHQFHSRAGYWLREFLTFNFRRVFVYVAVQGRALINTFVVVALALLATLIINPMAAYALSRFRLRASSGILLFCLATMAFPPMIITIPNFLLLRQFHLLNTFVALIMPYLANGFSIFLLKGFFDSLPPELYEAATIDGASELTIFCRVTMPLSKPVLAYLSMLAFLYAYGNFMWPFLTCQDEKMWTLMVWLYQFNYMPESIDYPYMSMAALVLASIPTFIVFMSCQKVILRGIVVPTMK